MGVIGWVGGLVCVRVFGGGGVKERGGDEVTPWQTRATHKYINQAVMRSADSKAPATGHAEGLLVKVYTAY